MVQISTKQQQSTPSTSTFSNQHGSQNIARDQQRGMNTTQPRQVEIRVEEFRYQQHEDGTVVALLDLNVFGRYPMVGIRNPHVTEPFNITVRPIIQLTSPHWKIFSKSEFFTCTFTLQFIPQSDSFHIRLPITAFWLGQDIQMHFKSSTEEFQGHVRLPTHDNRLESMLLTLEE